MFILAPNYPAGTDSLTGFKRYYKGELSGEVYTKVGQTDYAAEIAQIRAFRRRFGVLLPARRHGHRLHEAVCAVGRRHSGAWARASPSARTCSARSATPRSASRTPRSWSQGPRQRDEQGVRRGLPGRIQPPAVDLCGAGLRHGQPDPVGAGQGQREGRGRLPRGAEGSRLQFRARQVHASTPTTIRSRTSMSARWSRKATC